MIEFPAIAGRHDDAPRSARQTEGKAAGFANALEEAVRAAGEETEARPERPGPACTDSADDRQSAAAPKSDKSSAGKPDGQLAQPEDEPVAEAIPATQDVNDAAMQAGETTTAIAPAPSLTPVPEESVGQAEGVPLSKGADIAGVADSVETDGPAVADEPADGVLDASADVVSAVVIVASAAMAETSDQTATNITTMAGQGEAPASAAETAPPTAAQDPQIPANPAAETSAAVPVVPAEPTDKTSSVAPTGQAPDWAAVMAAPPRSATADAALAANPASPMDHKPRALANGTPAAAGNESRAPILPDAAAQPAKIEAALQTDKPIGATASAFANVLVQVDDEGAKPPTSPTRPDATQKATGNVTAASGQIAAPAQPGAPDAAMQKQSAGASAADQTPTTQAEPRSSATGAPQVQAATPTSHFANEIRIAANLSPANQSTSGQTAPSMAAQQISFQIGRSVQNGNDRFTLELKPADLGRVSVKLEIGFDHRVIAVISADRADTLDLLQRDARVLERALQDSGLKTDSGSLSFNLRGDGAGGHGADPDVPARQLAAMPMDEDLADALVGVPTTTIARTDGSGINIQV